MKTTTSRRKFLNRLLGGTIAATLPAFGFSKHRKTNSNHFQFENENTEDYWKLIRTSFPLDEKRIYFNTGSLGASPRVVIDTVYDWTLKLERIGEGRHDLFSKIREKAAEFIDCDIEELAFTRNTTEGINIIASSLPLKKGDEVILSRHAHVGGAAPWLALQKSKGISIKLIDFDQTGENNLEIIKNSISKKTKAVVISHITCTTGLKLPIKEIVTYCREKKIYSCVDGAHPLGMIKISMKDLNPDFYATSGHKWLLGPKGTGFLFINKNVIEDLEPVYAGAYSGEYDLEEKHFEPQLNAHREEYGTRSTPIVMGIGAAISMINAIGIERIEQRGRDLSNYLKVALSKIPSVDVLTPMDEKYSAAIVTFKVKGIPYEKVQQELLKKHRIRTRGIHESGINGIRISCAIYNNYEQIDLLISALNELITTNKKK